MIRKALSIFLAGMLALALPVSIAAQALEFEGLRYDRVAFVSVVVEDDDTGVASESPIIWVKYVGALESGTVDLNANALEFFSGDLGSENNAPSDSSDVNVGDVCGTANNALDVTDAQCDTPEELVAVINASGAPWVAVLAGITQDETLSTAAEYVDPADAQAKRPGGLALFIDSTDVDSLGLLFRPDVGLASRNSGNVGLGDIELFLNAPAGGSYTQTLKENPFDGQRAYLTSVVAVVDSTGAWDLNIFARRYVNGSVDERLVYSTSATTDATDEILDFSRAPIISAPGETFLIEVVDDAMVTARIAATGGFIPAR